MFSKVLTGLLALVPLVMSSLTIDHLRGPWVQTYSDYFVQMTTEIDWHCVRVNFTDPVTQSMYLEGSLVVTKDALLHSPLDGPRVTSPPKIVSVDAEGSTMTLWVNEASVTYDVRMAEDDLVVVTGATDPSVYVWTKNATAFWVDRELQVLAELFRWGYYTIDKRPLPSFQAACEF